MWLYTIEEIKEMIKQGCIVNGHNTKYWKEHLKYRKKLLKGKKCQS